VDLAANAGVVGRQVHEIQPVASLTGMIRIRIPAERVTVITPVMPISRKQLGHNWDRDRCSSVIIGTKSSSLSNPWLTSQS